MPNRVFTAEAMQACAGRGHRWRHVRAWHCFGFDECATCGETKSRPSVWDITFGEPVILGWPTESDQAQPATRNVAEPRPRKVRVAKDVERNAEIVRLVADGMGPSAVARQFNLDPSRVSQIVAKHRAAASVASTGEP